MRKALAILALPMLAACSTSGSANKAYDVTAVSELKAPRVATIQGTVKEVKVKGRHFVLQDASGKVMVDVETKKPVKVRKGDLVAADGALDMKGEFDAVNVTVISPAQPAMMKKAPAKAHSHKADKKAAEPAKH